MSAEPPKTVPSSGGKVPLVSEVLERLVAELGGEASRRPAFFQAALQVCSEELRSVKAGGRAATLEELVARSRKLLGTPAVKPAAAVAAAAAPAPAAASAPRQAAIPPAAPSLPFPDEEPTGQHVLPAAEAVRKPRAVADEDLFTIDETSEPTVVTARAAASPPPAPAPAPAPPTPPLVAPRPAPTAATPSAVSSGAGAPAAAARPPGPPARLAHQEEPLPIAAPAVRDLFGSLAGDSGPLLETPTREALGEPYIPTRFEPYGPDAPSPRSRRTLLRVALGGTGLVAVVVAALWLFGGTFREAVLPTTASSAPTPAATPRYQSVFEPEAATTDGASEGSRTAPTAVVQPTRPPVPTPQPTAVAATAEPGRRTRAATVTAQAAVMVSADWANRPPVYAIHFSSYQDRSRAERDAADIGAAHGRPAAVAAVDLGARGLWYRVVLTGFASYEEARAYHTRLRAQGAPGVGGVYYLVGPE